MSETTASTVHTTAAEEYRRLEYAAVPLNPYEAMDDPTSDHSERYDAASFARIRRKLGDASIRAIEYGWYTNNLEQDEIRRSFIEDSLIDSHIVRMVNNMSHNFQGSEHRGENGEYLDPRVERAMNGWSNPAELFSLLCDYPKLGSIELAKLTHPFDQMATNEMDKAIISDVIYANDMTEPRPIAREDAERGKRPRADLPAPVLLGDDDFGTFVTYKMKRRISEEDFTAAILVRKQPIAEHETQHGTLQIVRRSSLIVRGDKDAHELDPNLASRIGNNKRFSGLAQKAENYLPHLELAPELRWMQPTTTSYYAKYINQAA